MANSRNIIGWILAIVGLFYIIPFLSNAVTLGIESYTVRLILGIILLVIGALMLWHKKH